MQERRLGIPITLLRNGDVYAPEPIGRTDILVIGETIAAMGPDAATAAGAPDVEIDLGGAIVVPGFIDYHNHMLGGGSGLAGRVPPLMLSQLTMAGITTVVGCLGFDTITRSLEDLLALARTLEHEGITTYIYSGGTQSHPIVTFTGNIARDMFLVDKVIGPGEVSLSELGPTHPTMGPGTEHIAKVAADARAAARMTGKSGLVNLQIPTGGLAPLFDIVDTTGMPARQFVPSHSNLYPHILEEAFRFGKLGGWCDFSSSYVPEVHKTATLASRAVVMALDAGVPLELITLSTDGNGGYPLRDEHGRVVGTHYLSPSTLHERFREIVQVEGLPVGDAVRTISTNVAEALCIEDRKGRVRSGADADLVVLDGDLRVRHVVARGRVLVRDGVAVVRGSWEDHRDRAGRIAAGKAN